MLTLPHLAILLGTLLLGSHLFGLKAADFCMTAAKKFPRSRLWATVLLSVTAVWVLVMVSTGDLGEFSPMRPWIEIGTVVGAFLLWKFVPDFLSSRCVGFLLLLAAHPVLETTFLQHGFLHYALAILAYLWALTGLFLVGMPYLHRDAIAWICGNKQLWNMACWAGVFAGAILLIEGLRLAF